MSRFKNKTLAVLLASLGGTLGLHRFYLGGRRDLWAWLHCASLPVSLLTFLLVKDIQPFFAALPLIFSALAAALTALVMGTTPDEKWDSHYNAGSERQSDSGWPLALLLVLSLAVGAGALILTIARTFDLMMTGGSYG